MTATDVVAPPSRPAGGRHPLGRPPAAAIPDHVLADIAAGFAAAVPLWSEVVRHDADGRQPVLLVATEAYEVWVIGWTTGQHVRMHDHGDSAGAVVVTSGELHEVLPDRSGGTVELPLPSGTVRHLPVGIVHDVVNRAAEPATSIHVYSPPVTRMTYYDPDTLAPVDSEEFPAETPLLGRESAARVLHPAGRCA